MATHQHHYEEPYYQSNSIMDSPSSDATMVALEDDDVNINDDMRTSDKADKIKRPMNAFMLWSKLRRREISKNDPTIHNAQISKLLGEEWKVLPLEEKQPFLKESQKLMVKHKREHPNYRYKPRKSKADRSVGDGERRINSYLKKPYIPPTKARPYPQFSSHSSYSHSSRRIASSSRSEAHSIPKHHPIIYYQGFRECNIPGCYECEYQRPYDNRSSRQNTSQMPLSPSYRCHDEYANEAPRCLCCSPPPPPPPCMGCSHPNHQQSYSSHSSNNNNNRREVKKWNNFSVESLIKTRGVSGKRDGGRHSPHYPSSSSSSSDCGGSPTEKSNHPSSRSPSSTTSSSEGSGDRVDDKHQMNEDHSGSEGKSYGRSSCSDESLKNE